MKKILGIILSFLFLTLTACGVLQKAMPLRIVPIPILQNSLVSRAQDCMSLENGNTGYGDLLSTLAISSAKTNNLPIKVLNQEYSDELRQLVGNFMHAQHHADLYASIVCHVNTGLDMVAGVVLPTAMVNESEPSAWGKTATILMVHDGSVKEFRDIPLFDNTATGADVSGCKVHEVMSGVEWKCFQYLAKDQAGDVIGSHMKTWLLPFDHTEVTATEADEE